VTAPRRLILQRFARTLGARDLRDVTSLGVQRSLTDLRETMKRYLMKKP